MKYLKLNFKTFYILGALALSMTLVGSYGVFSASSKEISLTKDLNDFTKASLNGGNDTGVTPQIDITATAAGAFSDGGKKVFGWGTAKRWPIASITKLMTAVVVSEKMRANDVIQITSEMLAANGDSGFIKGQKYKVSDLKKAMLMLSSNDAAYILATSYGEADFIAAMNQKASDLRMKETHYIDPAGFSTQNQSTVNDLVILAGYIRGYHPDIFNETKKTKNTITETKTGKRRTLININKFAGQKGFLGGKTGTTPEAGENLLSIFNIAGEAKTIIVLGDKNRYEETQKIINSLWQ